MFRRTKENKAKLEHKLYLARESPEPIFDLSDCGLQNIPQGIYSLCRVFLKERLQLERNWLSSLSGGGSLKDLCLLIVLDLQYNSFTSLPDEIHLLTNLSELYLNQNQIKKLPESLCKLKNLHILEVSCNHLKCLPFNMGDLENLIRLNVIGNKNLISLPKSMCRNQKLSCLLADAVNFIDPSSSVMEKEAEFVIKYLCNEAGFSYTPLEKSADVIDSPKTNDHEDHSLEDKIWTLENKKKQKMLEFLEIEKNNELLQRQEIELANSSKMNKKKLLADITEQQNKFDLELAKVQQEKDVEKFRLIEQLQEAEMNAELTIKKMLALNETPMTQLLEQEKLEEEKLLVACSKYNEALRKSDVLQDMQNLLTQEATKFEQFAKNRSEITRNILEEEMQLDSRLSEILQNQDSCKTELLSCLQEDSELQKAVVGTLLERADARSWGLIQQVKMVEAQLAALSSLEIDRQKLNIDKHLNNLAEKRSDLSALLVNLLDQQAERRAQLLSTLRTIEEENMASAEDFWLKQYQRLLECLPDGLSETQKNMDPLLVESLLMSGVIHCLPFLAKLTQKNCDIDSITENELAEAGIVSSADRCGVLEAFRYFSKQKVHSEPSAPLLMEKAEASAPPIESASGLESECVVCMDVQCQVIFVPCGHLCCCTTCSDSISDCPMCRATIERKIRIIVA